MLAEHFNQTVQLKETSMPHPITTDATSISATPEHVEHVVMPYFSCLNRVFVSHFITCHVTDAFIQSKLQCTNCRNGPPGAIWG